MGKVGFLLLALFLGISSAEAGQIPLTLSNPAGVKLSRCPVSIAVPLPAGELFEGEGVQLVDAKGRPIPAQFRPLTKWWARGKSIQTLLVTFIADTSVAEYHLVHGKDVVPPKPDCAVTVAEQADRIVVQNGPLRAVFGKTRFRLFDELSVEGSEVIAGPGGLSLGEFSSAGAAPERVGIEESGPIRAIVAVHGHYANANGEKQLGYLVRLHFYAGVPAIRIEHTFLQDTGRVFVDVPSVSLDLALPPGGRKVEFGAEGEAAKAFASAPADRLSLVQTGPEPPEKISGLENESFKKILAERRKWWGPEEEALWERDKRGKAFEAKWTINGREAAKCEKASGWVRISPESRPWAMTAGVRWFPQLHPKGIHIEGDRLRLFLVPPMPRPLHLHLGAAKTHTVFLAFHKPGDEAASMAYRDAVEAPPLVFPSPEWMCASKVWGDMVPRRAGRFRYYEDRAADWVTKTYTESVERSQAYGLMNFGDHIYSRGQWNNLETAEDYGVLVEFLRTGDRKFFDYFERAIYHFRDVDVSHADLAEGQFDYGLWLMPGYMPEKLAKECAASEALRKEMFYYLGDQPPPKGGIRRHSFRHFANAGFTPAELDSPYPEKRGRLYGGTCAVSGHGWIIGTVAHYMLTGDPYSRDTAEMTGDLILRKLTANNWGRDNWKNIDAVHLYKMTGREDYRKHVRQAIDFFHENRGNVIEKLGEQRATRAAMSPWYTIGHFVRDYYDITNDTDVAAKFVDMVDVWINETEKDTADSGCGNIFTYIRDFKDSRCHGDFADLAYASKITGRPRYLERGMDSLKVYMRHAYHSTCLFEMPKILWALSAMGVDPLDYPYAPLVTVGGGAKGYVSETTDGAFTVFVGQDSGYRVAAQPVEGTIRVKSPSGKPVTERRITRSGVDFFALRIPTDGETGVYVIEAEAPKVALGATCDLPISSYPPPRVVEGKFGKAVELADGARLRYPAAGKVCIEQGTIEMMIRPLWSSPEPREQDVPYHYHQLFDSRDAGYDQGFTINLWDSGKKGEGKSLMAGWSEVDKSEGISAPCNWKKGEWRRVALTYRRTAEGRGDMALYVDGQCVGRKDGAGNFPTRPPRPEDTFVIGINSTGSPNTALSAAVDWVRISKIVRSEFPDSQPSADAETTFLVTFEDPTDLGGQP